MTIDTLDVYSFVMEARISIRSSSNCIKLQNYNSKQPYYRAIALILVDIVPSWDIEGRELASAITLLLYSYKYLPLI